MGSIFENILSNTIERDYSIMSKISKINFIENFRGR